MPTEIVFEGGRFPWLKELIRERFGECGVFCLTDKGIRKAEIADSYLSLIDDSAVFDEVEPNPRHTTINRAAEIVRKQKPAVIVGIGGGSVLDAAKAVAILAANPGGIEDYEGKARYHNIPLPVIAVPTTCGTGSEVTWVSVITHTERRFKMSIKGPEMFPRLAVIDPDLLKSLPASLVAATGLDALTHAVEAFTVKPATFMTDLFARESMQLIFQSLEPAWRDIRKNAAAREALMKGSLLAGIAFGNSDVGAVHCIAESVGSMYDSPHGVVNSIFLPYVMEYNLPAVSSRLAEIARMAGIIEPDEKAAAEKLIGYIRKLSRKMGIPSFEELGVREKDLPLMAQKSFENNSTPSNAREVKTEDYLKILEAAYHNQASGN